MQDEIEPQGGGEVAIGGYALPSNWLARIVLIWSGYALSAFAGSAASYAAIWYVTESTQSPLALALVYVFAFLPMGLLSPFGGVVADKHNRKAIIIAMDAVLVVSGLALTVVIWLAGPSFIVVLVFCGMYGVTGGFRTPAFNATMPLLVPERHLMRINTLDGLLGSISMIAAPALGILLYTSIGLQACMLVSGLGALAAVLTMLLAKVPRIAQTAETLGALASLKEGARTLAGERGLLILVIAVSLGMLAYGPIDSLLPLMVSSHFGGDGFAASLVAAAMGVGMLIGSVVLMVANFQRGLPVIIFVAAEVVGLGALVGGLLPSSGYVAFVVCVGVLAIACAWFSAPLMTLMQKIIPEDRLGRVIGLFTALYSVAIPVGTAIGGAIAQVAGTPMFFVFDGVFIMVLGIATIAPKSVRAL